MPLRRMVMAVTCLVTAGGGVALTVMRWDNASRMMTIIQTLGTVATLGVAIWAAVPAGRSAMRTSNTGRGRATSGGRVNTGIQGRVASIGGACEVDRSGEADASGGGQVNTGIHLH